MHGVRKKIFITILAIVMCFNMLVIAAPNTDFPDMTNHWAKSMVSKLVGYKIVDGYEDGTYRPNDNINVDAFIKLVITSIGYQLNTGGDYWASPYIDKAIELGLIDAGEFENYGRPINRSEMAKIVVNALNKESDMDLNSLKAKIYDYSEIEDPYKEYVLRAYGEKIITGYEDDTFRPYNNATRAEAATIIIRLIDKNGGISVPIEPNNETPGGQMVASTAKLYVSTTGNDNNDGSEERPFKTIQKAKETIRNMNRSNTLPNGGVTVYIREGTYYIYEGMEFTKEDSGKDGSQITYTAYPGESVTISGNIPIEKEWFKTADKEAQDKIIDKNAAKKVLMVNLKEKGITDYGELNTRGYHYFNKGRYMPAELIVNGENQVLARYPNEGTIPVKNDLLLPEELGFSYTDERISKWAKASDIWIVGTLSINYENNAYPIKKIDTSSKKVLLREGKIQDYYTNGWFFAENLLEELDTVGEYYIDRENGILYYMPPEDFATGNYTIGLSTLKTPVFHFNGATNITISNITMEGGRGYAVIGASEGYKIPTYSEFLKSQNISETSPRFDPNSKNPTILNAPSNYPDAQVFPGHIWDGFQDNGVGVNGIEIKNCEVRNFGSGGIIIRGNNIKIENNRIKNIGGTGLYLFGGNLETLEPSGNTIIGNEIHNIGYQHRAYNPAIAIHGVGIHVAHNDIYDAPHCIFNYHGNDHIIEYNKIHDAVKECLDMDAIYTRNEYMPQWRGTIIRYNYIYNLGIFSVGEYTKQLNISGIRTDNYGHGLQIYNNIFANIGTEGANSVIGVTAQGSRNIIKGNMFIDTSTTFRGWDTYVAGATWDMTKEEERARVELVEKYAANPIFAEKYPELLTFKDEYYKSVATNVFDNNLVVNIKFGLSHTNGTPNPSSTRGAVELIKGDNNIVTTKDPGFVDYKNGNYQLKADSEVFKKIPDFENVDMSKFGPIEPVGPIK